MTLFDDMVADAEAELLDLDAARAEIWVSSVFGTWRQPGDDGELAPEEVDHLLLDHLAAHPSRGALAIAIATATTAPEALAARAWAVVDGLRAQGVADPPWAPYAGTAQPLCGYSLRDRHGSGESLVIGFEHADGIRHALLVEVDHDELDGRGMAVDLLFSPGDLLETIAAGADPTLRVEPSDPSAIAARALEALAATRAHPDPIVTDEFVMNLFLVEARLHTLVATAAADDPSPPAWGQPIGTGPEPAVPERDRDAERWCAEVLASALRHHLSRDPADLDIEGAAGRVRSSLREGTDADLILTARAAGIGDPTQLDDVTLLHRIATALIVPTTLVGFPPADRELIRRLEPADWLGVVIELAREGAGASVDADRLVTLVNRCPEVTTTIPRRDAPGVARAFAACLFTWDAAGVTGDDRLTALGAWLLPRAVYDAWR